MIAPDDFAACLSDQGVRLVTGVPDTILKTLLPSFDAHPAIRHVITTSEGEAAAMAFGHRLATGDLTLTYLQNSGLGDVLDILTSLASSDVYDVPLLFLVGWRGQVRVPDEPQHRRMGELTEALLRLADIRCELITSDGWRESVMRCCEAVRLGTSCALLVAKGTFSGDAPAPPERGSRPSREDALSKVIEAAPPNAVFVSTVGGISRELYEWRARAKQLHTTDLYLVGALGSVLAVAHGVALARPDMKVIVLDGDGSLLMGLGALATVGHLQPGNLLHVVFDNGVHDSTGGQPTASHTSDLAAIARACGYRSARTLTDEDGVVGTLRLAVEAVGPAIVVIKVRPGSRSNLGRPSLEFARHGREFEGACNRGDARRGG